MCASCSGIRKALAHCFAVLLFLGLSNFIAVPARAQHSTPDPRFVCHTGYTPKQCEVTVAVLRRALALYPASVPVDWTWVVVRTEDWKRLLLDRGFNPDNPAFTYLPKRETFLDGALLTKVSTRGVQLSLAWHMPIEELLDLAVRHELVHALCSERNETRTDLGAVALKNGTSLHCEAPVVTTENRTRNQGQGRKRETQILASHSSEISDLLKQAQSGDRIAQFNVASLCLQGVGVPQDYKNAAKWYERAAEQGLAAAQFMMGFLYEQGKGLQRDYAQALNYYRAAADQGHAPAANNLGGLYLHGFGVPKNIGTALKWYQFSAERGGAIGQYNLATIYFVGKGVPKDYREAARWFRVAAEQGFPAAENDLAFLYFTGEGVVQDYGEAFKWMSRAADQGYAQAQINLGDLYIEGKGVPLDYVSAYMWYTLASGQDPRAAARLKNLSGLITPKQRIEGENQASSWLSSHRSLDSQRASSYQQRLKIQVPMT
jgi:TPR repeat protein